MPAAWRAGGPSISIRTAVLPPSTRRCTRRPPLRTWPRRLGHSTFPPVRPPDFQRRGIGGSWEQDVKAFLGEVAVVGEDVGKALAAHGLHGNTVGQAIPLVQAGFIEGQASQERGTRLRQNNDIVIRKNAPGKQRSPSPRARYPLTVESKKLRQDFIGGIEAIGIQGVIESLDPSMPLITTIGQGNPIERIDKKSIHVERLGRP